MGKSATTEKERRARRKEVNRLWLKGIEPAEIVRQMPEWNRSTIYRDIEAITKEITTPDRNWQIAALKMRLSQSEDINLDLKILNQLLKVAPVEGAKEEAADMFQWDADTIPTEADYIVEDAKT